MNLLIASLFIIVFDCKMDTHSYSGEQMEYCETNFVDDCSQETILDYTSEGHTVAQCYKDEPVLSTYVPCTCSTDMECVRVCGGSGNPDPVR